MISSYPSPPTEDQAENIAGLYWVEPDGFRREPDGATVTLTGDLPHWRRHISKQGMAYATGVLRRPDGDVPLLVPPTVYSHVGGLLGEDAQLTITGKVDRRGPIHGIVVNAVTEPAPTELGRPAVAETANPDGISVGTAPADLPSGVYRNASGDGVIVGTDGRTIVFDIKDNDTVVTLGGVPLDPPTLYGAAVAMQNLAAISGRARRRAQAAQDGPA